MHSNMEDTFSLGMPLFDQIHSNKRKVEKLKKLLARRNIAIDERERLKFTTPFLKTFLMLARIFRNLMKSEYFDRLDINYHVEDTDVVTYTPHNLMHNYGWSESNNQWSMLLQNLKILSQTRSFFYQSEAGDYVQDISPFIILRIIRENNSRGRIKLIELEYPRIWRDYLFTFFVQVPMDFFEVLDEYHDYRSYHVSKPLFLLWILGLRGIISDFEIKLKNLFERIGLSSVPKHRQNQYWQNAVQCAKDLRYLKSACIRENKEGEQILYEITPHPNIINESIREFREGAI